MDNFPKIPQYRMIYETLRKQIIDGVYKEGDLLPSENQLCAQYGLTRPTIRHALDALLYEGLISKHRGKGSIISNQPKGIGILSISGTTLAVGRENLTTKILSKPAIIKWPQPFMYSLTDLELEVGCIYIERLRLVDNVPVFYDINYLPNINLPRFTSRSFENKSLFDLLRKNYQIEVKGGEQKIWSIHADEKISSFLEISKGQPILHLERKINTNRTGYSFFSSIYCNTKNHAIYGTF